LRYLFELSGNPPAKSFMDDNFSWLYPQPSIEGTVDKILLVTDRQESSGFEVQAEKTFGAITGYIFKP